MLNTYPEIIEDAEPESSKKIDQGYIQLPFNQAQFGEFIQSLLGSPQTISKVFEGSFEIISDDIRILYQLITQRVKQQNAGILIQFTSKIIYSDNSSVELTTIDDFLAYNEVKPIVSKALHLKWDFLVRFNDKQTPERQRIQVSFISSHDVVPIFDEDMPIYRAIFKNSIGTIGFRIEHTARTWGADIEALLSNHIKSLIKQEPPYKKFIREHNGKISFAIGASFFLSTLIVSFLATKRFANIKTLEVKQFLVSNTNVDLSVVNEKINYLSQFLAGGEWSQFYFSTAVFLMLSLFISIWFGVWIESATDTHEPSFLLLTKESSKYKEKAQKKLGKKWISFIIAICTSITTGIIANILFMKLFS